MYKPYSSVGVMKKKKKKMEKIEVRPISVYNCSGILWECLWVENHSQTMIIYLKRLKSSMFVRVKAVWRHRRVRAIPT